MVDFKDIIVKRNCEHELNNGLVTVLYKKDKLNFFERTFYKKLSSKPYKIDLDEIGSFIWLTIGNGISVEEIIKISEEKFGDKIQPAKERIELFIKQMNKNKLVSLYKKTGQ